MARKQRGDDNDDDYIDDDDDVLVLIHFPQRLPVCDQNNLDMRTLTVYEIVRTAVSYQSVAETVLTICGILSLITRNQVTTGTYPWYCMYSRKIGRT